MRLGMEGRPVLVLASADQDSGEERPAFGLRAVRLLHDDGSYHAMGKLPPKHHEANRARAARRHRHADVADGIRASGRLSRHRQVGSSTILGREGSHRDRSRSSRSVSGRPDKDGWDGSACRAPGDSRSSTTPLRRNRWGRSVRSLRRRDAARRQRAILSSEGSTATDTGYGPIPITGLELAPRPQLR